MSQRAGKWLRAAGVVLLSLILLLGALWVTLPGWAPLAVERALPAGWRVTVLEVRRRGLTAVHIDELVLRGEAGGLVLAVDAKDLSLAYAGPAVGIERARLRVQGGMATTTPGFDWTDPRSYSLPALRLPGFLPGIRIGRLALDTDTSAAGDFLVLTGLQSFSGSGSFGATAHLERHRYLDSALDIRLETSSGEVQLEFTPAGTAQPASTVNLRGAGGGGDGQGESRLEFDIALSTLAPGVPGILLQAAGLGEAVRLEGRLSGRALFGEEPGRQLHSADLAFEEMVVQSGTARLALSTSLGASLRDSLVDWHIDALDLEADISGGMWPDLLRRELDRAGVTVQPLGQRLRVVASAPAPIEGRIDAGAPHPLRLNGELVLEAHTPDALSLTLQLAEFTLRADAFDAFEALEDFSLSADVDGALEALAPLRIGAADVEATVEDARADFAGGITLQGSAFDSLALRALDLRGGALSLALADGGPLLQADGFRLNANTVKGGGMRVEGTGELSSPRLPPADLRMQRLDLRVESFALPGGSGRLHATTTGMEISAGDSTYSGFDIDARGDLSGGTSLDGSGALLFGTGGSLPFDYTSDLKAGTGEVVLDAVSLPATELAAAAPALGLSLPQNFDLNGGTIFLDGRVRMGATDQPAAQGRVEARAEQIAFSLGESRVRDLSFTTRFELGETIVGGGPVTVDRVQLAAGVEVAELSTRLEMDGTSDLSIVDLRAGLLDGRLEADALRLVQGELTDSVLRWQGFKLERLLAVLDIDGLTGSGVLDASLPLVREDAGLAVRDGSLSARRSGLIRYRPDIAASNIGLQALQNFHYESLEGGVNYASGNGDYSISLELRGNNPDLYGGHPVHLNLAIDGNMPALFRSLFLTGNFERAIVNQLRSGEALSPD